MILRFTVMFVRKNYFTLADNKNKKYMRKKLCLWCNFVIVAVLFLSSCRNEDFSSSLAESKREEEFFRNNTEGADFKNVNTSLVSSTISKLKNLNDKTDFISKLSDKDGLPAWNYIAKSKIKTANKGGDGGQILIVPLKVEDGFLSSLMYVKNADSSDPTVYTVTNEQLKDFAENKSIDKDTRESILRTFISFDNAMFGSRLYSSIPSDLFENVPLKENHDHKSFTIGQYEPTQNMDIEQCFMTFHCKNQLEESRCDMCWKCVSITCPLGGGNTDYEPDFPNSPGGNDDGGNDGGGQTNPNIPWYLQNPEIDIFSYSPIVQSVFQSLTDYGIVLHVSQVNYLQENNTIAQRFRTYLASDNSLVKSQNANMGINFFIDNPGATWQDFLNQVPKTPCEKITKIGKNSKTKDLFGLLKPKTNSTKESGYILTESGGSIYETYIEGNTGEHSINFSVNTPIDGFIHSHYIGLLSVFSVSDMFALAQLYKNGKIKDMDSFVIGVVTASNTQYMMVIDDPAKFGAFADNLFTGNQIDQKTQDLYEIIYEGYGIKTSNTASNNEGSFLSYLQSNKTGLKLLKGDSTFGNWQILNKDSNGTVIPQNCP